MSQVAQKPSPSIAYAQAYALEEGHLTNFDVSKAEVSLTPFGPQDRGRHGTLTEEVVAFAQKLG
jgi:hypothetical protein